MTKFLREGRIPCCFVTKSLLANIEAYLNGQMRQRLGERLGDDINYRISIKERIGTETLGSVSEYSANRFSDDTKEIEIRWDNGYESDFRLDIVVDLDGSLISTGQLRVECTGAMARETAIGVGDAILRLLKSHRTYNWIFNPLPEFPIISMFALILLAYGLLAIVSGVRAQGLYLFVGVASIGWIFVSATFFRPRISFDTRRQELLDRIWRYFSFGTLGFVFFGTLLPLVRKAIFGF